MLDNLGLIDLLLGNYERAREQLLQSLQICRDIGDRAGEGETSYDLSLLFHHLGDNETACDYGQQSLRIAEQTGHWEMRGYALTHLGHALAALDRPAEAAAAYQSVVDLRREHGQSNLIVAPLAGLARIAMAQGDLAQARAHVQEILAHLKIQALGGTEEPARVYLTCYRVLQADQDPRAREILEKAYNWLQELAADIADKNLRRSLLENVTTHREVIEAWEEGKVED